MENLKDILGSTCDEVFNNMPILEVAMLKMLEKTPVNEAAALAKQMLEMLNSVTRQLSRAGYKNQSHYTKTRKVLKFIVSNPEEYYKRLNLKLGGVECVIPDSV